MIKTRSTVMLVLVIVVGYILLLVTYWKNLAARIPLLIGCAVVFLITYWCCYKCHSKPDVEDKEKDSLQVPDDLLPVTTAPTSTTACRDIDHVTRDGDMIMLPMPDEETHANVTEIDHGVQDHVVDLATSNKDWWIDIGATRHVCFDRNLFVEYKEFENDDFYVCNSKEATSSKAMGQGKVVLKFTSGKEVTLNQVLYVPNIRKNLISGSMLLSKDGFRMIVESNYLVLNKGEMYVGIACLTDPWIII